MSTLEVGTKVLFGKYKGLTIGSILRKDSAYLKWLLQGPFADRSVGDALAKMLRSHNDKVKKAYSNYLQYKRVSY